MKNSINRPLILIVDDIPENLIVLEKILKKLDVDLVKAGSGNEALSHTLYNDFALIILDVQMPEMDGYEVAEILKSDENTANIPIIFVTAIDKEYSKEIKGYDRGGVDFIFKPLNDYIILCKVKIFIDIYKMKVGLEELVAGRTNELQQINTKLQQEIKSKIKTEEELKRSKLELTVRNDIANVFLTIQDEEMYGHILSIIFKATKSICGVFGYIDESGDLFCPSITRDVWEKCRISDKAIIFLRNKSGSLLNRALIEKKTICSNKPLHIPEEYIPILKAIAVPIIHHDKVIGIIIVANKDEDYDEKDIQLLESITGYIATVLNSKLERDKQEKERMRLEEVMIQSEKMLSVGGLAAGMAHEINNPLAGIMQTANVMASRLGENMDIPANVKAAEAAGTSMAAIKNFMEARGILRMLTTINESGKRVAGIVNNMLSFARKSDQHKSYNDIGQLFDKTLELAAVSYDIKKHYDFKMIEIEKEYEHNLPSVYCEGSKIQQVLLNILHNGAQAMQEAGIMNPRFILRIRLKKFMKMLEIEIEDNGPGMDEETRKRVFEPFFTTKAVGVGTGLGLSVSYFIITENHGGELIVKSRPGSGAQFIINLPLEGKNKQINKNDPDIRV